MSDYNQSFNIFKSLSSVHLPPPPSSKSHPTFEFSHDQQQKSSNTNHHQDSHDTFMAPNNAFKYRASPKSSSGVALTDISALNTPPPSQSRANAAVTAAANAANVAAAAAANSLNSNLTFHKLATPTLSRRGPENKENMYTMMSPMESSPLSKPEDSVKKPTLITSSHSSSISSTSSTGRATAATAPPPKFNQQQVPRQDKRKYLSEIPDPEDLPPMEDDGKKPPYSYATLIGMAILRSPNRKLTLSQIYQWINDTFAWYKHCKSGWQNSIRHNLSLNKAFSKQERPKGDPGKGNYWLVEPGYEYLFLDSKSARRSSTSQVTFYSKESVVGNTPSSIAATVPDASFTSTGNSSIPMSRSSTTDEEENGDDDELNNSINDNFNDKHDDEYDDDIINSNELDTPLKRCNTAIGLQRPPNFHSTSSSISFSNESVPTKRSLDDSSEPKSRKKRINSLGRGIDTGKIPSLTPKGFYDDTAMMETNLNMAPLESPKQYISGNLILGPNKPHLCPPSTAYSQPPGNLASPNTSIRNHRAAIKNLTASPEIDDIFGGSSTNSNSNSSLITSRTSMVSSASPLRNRVQEDDSVSRLIFGSPDRRDTHRRQYYEQSDGFINLFNNQDLFGVDLYGVDLYQLCQREIERGGEEDEDDGDFNGGASSTNKTPAKAAAFGQYRFDSPIKNQMQNLSPPKMIRKKTA